MAKGRIYEMAFRIGGKLAASFGASTAAAAKGLSDLERKALALSTQQRMLQRFGAVGTAFGGVRSEASSLARDLGVLTAAGTGAAAALFAVAKSTADLGDRAIKTAQNLSVDVEVLQELWYAAQRSGASQEDLNKALRKMSVGLGQAVQGTGEAKRWLDLLGLSAQQMAAMRPEEAMGRLADGLRSLPGPAARAAAAQAIFGEGALKLGVLLDEGSEGMRRLREEARATGGVLSRQAAEGAATFQDRLLDLQLTLAGLKNTVGAALLPVFTDLFTKLAAWLRTNRERVAELAERFARWLEDTIPKLVPLLSDLARLARTVSEAAQRTAELVGGWDRLALIIVGIRLAPLVVSVVQLGQALWAAVPAAWSLSAALLANPVGLMAVAVAVLTAEITLAVVYWDEWTAVLRSAGWWLDAVVLAMLPLVPTLMIPVLLIRHWERLGALWGRVSRLATSLGETLSGVWGIVRVVALAAVDVWLLVQRPVVLLLVLFHRIHMAFWGLMASLFAGFWGLVWDVVGPVVERIGALWSVLSGVLQIAAAVVWEAIRTGWGMLVDWLSGLWDEWGDTVIATARWVAGQALQALTAPLRAGLSLAKMIPGDAAPNLAELVARIEGAAAPAAPTAPIADGSDRLAGAVTGRERARQVSAPLTVDYRPQITVSGEGGADRAGMQAALKQGQDDLLERLRAAQEQQRRLSYG